MNTSDVKLVIYVLRMKPALINLIGNIPKVLNVSLFVPIRVVPREISNDTNVEEPPIYVIQRSKLNSTLNLKGRILSVKKSKSVSFSTPG